MIARTAFVALLLAIAIASLATRAEAAPGGVQPGERAAEPAAGENAARADRPTCRVVRVVHAGHGEAERAPCRPTA